MLEVLLWVAVGAFVGWNMPQPAYAVALQNWVVAKWKSFTNNDDES